MTDTDLEVRGVSKTFGSTRALSGVDFSIRRGEVMALVGQNGSGKSTLIKLMAGFHEPDAVTELRVRGRTCRLGDGDGAHAAGLRFVHQDLGVVSALSAVENLALGFGYSVSRTGRIRWREQRRKTREALSTLGYDIEVDKPLSDLAPVERTAVAVARALQGLEGDASVLVLDEPTATMPEPEVQRLFSVVRRVRDLGVSVLYVSHHLDEVFALADRVTIFRDGKVAAVEEVAHLERRRLVDLMVGGVTDVTSTDESVEEGTAPALEVRGLAGTRAKGVDLVVRPGEIVGLAGITGSGREEICTLLFGGRKRSGHVLVNGSELAQSRPDRSIAAGVGFVPANRLDDALLETMNVGENLTIADLSRFWRLFRFKVGAESKEVRGLVSRLGVRPARSDIPIESLSGGNQQKVVVGRWLRMDPTVLLLDEPTQGVDIAAKADIHRLIDEAALAGSAVLVSSSDEVELARLCHRVLVIRDGAVVREFRRPVITSAQIAQESLGVEPADQTKEVIA